MKLTVLKAAQLSLSLSLKGWRELCLLCILQLHLMLLEKRTVIIDVWRTSIQIIKVQFFTLLRERNYSAQFYIYNVNFNRNPVVNTVTEKEKTENLYESIIDMR